MNVLVKSEAAARPHKVRDEGRDRVLIVGGPDVNLRIDLMRALSSRYDVVAAGSETAIAGAFAEAGFEYHCYPLGRGLNPLVEYRTLRSLEAIIREVRPAVVHTFATKPSVWGRIAARRHGVRAVVGTIPGLGSLYTTSSLSNRAAQIVYERLQGYAGRCSDMTVFQNTQDLDYFLSSKIVSRDRSTLIPGSGVVTSYFDQAAVAEEERARIRAELGIEPGSIVVTMVGRVIRSKGVMEFAAAARAVQAHLPQVKFVLVGLDDRESLDGLTDEERALLRRSVQWVGQRNDVRSILSVTNIFALPTYYREGLPRVLLEAAAMALPLVTTGAPGCADVVVDGECGFVIPPRDPEALAIAVRRFAEDAELRQQFGSAARQRVEDRFELSVIVEQTTALYETILGAREGSSTVGATGSVARQVVRSSSTHTIKR